MAEAPKPCEESTPRPPGVIPIHRTSGIPRPRCTKRVVLPPPPPPPPVLAPCPGGQVRKLPRANSPCICPPSLPVFFENRICVATCPPGLGLINRGPNGACACPDNFEQIAVNGKCLPKCNPVTEVRDESGICVPRPPPIDKSKPIYIETGVELGAFEQSIIKVKTDTRVNEQRIKLEINPKSNEVVLKSIDTDEELFKLNGIPYEYIKRRMSGKPLTHMINGMGRVGQTEWPLYIKEVKTGQIRTFGFNQKRGVAIEFYPFDGNHYRVTNGKIVKGETWTHILFGEFNDYQ
jgi:hypothetical protein